jgi:hypothetical protein
MITITRSATCVAVMVSISMMPASGQSLRRWTPACSVDSGARWFVKQREWLDDAKHAWTDDTLRTNLLHAAGLEGAHLSPVQMGWEIETASTTASLTTEASAAIAQLRMLASTRGAIWPTKSVAGAMGTRAVWLLAHGDSVLTRSALKRMMEAGPEESSAADVATLEDRLRLQSGRKQIYGTQFRIGANGTLVLAPMEDSAHVDLRREDAGLPPFRTSACLAREVANRK